MNKTKDFTFKEAQKIFSPARMQKYLRACGGDEEKAMQLYAFNACLSQAFFGVVSLFEVVLRNAIIKEYLRYMAVDAEQVESLIMCPEKWLDEIDKLRKGL